MITLNENKLIPNKAGFMTRFYLNGAVNVYTIALDSENQRI